MLEGHYDDEAVKTARNRPSQTLQDDHHVPELETEDHVHGGASDLDESDEYDLVSHDDLISPSSQCSTSEVAAPYHFPGTWTKAQQDTNNALKEVASASKVFASALMMSGLGKAGRSVGSALMVTANRSAVMVAGAALNASGTDQGKLPGPLRKWLGTDALEASKQKKLQAKHAQALMNAKRELIESGQVVETSPDRVTMFTGPRQIYNGQTHDVSVNEVSPYASVSGRAYFDSPAASSGWKSRRQSMGSTLASSRPAVPPSPPANENVMDDGDDVDLKDYDEEDREEFDFGDLEGIFQEQ